ncbi:phospholipase D-like domain-containing protein [Pedobacter jamesrossensis]|uniref:phospholipase D n=1 Tax=Pedobacter jamesrossensis TaxID=1908238 RepID=A0ABV8NJ38_9SPHI
MRISKTKNGLKVQAIAGTYVVLLGIHLDEKDCKGLKGFSIHRTNHTAKTAGYLSGMKAFETTDPGYPSGSLYGTDAHPVQGFQWGDYDATPGHDYTYIITALKGSPEALMPFKSLSIKLQTESPEGGDHDIYFNRGTAASQEYVRLFGDKVPEKIVNGKAFEWLSRGLFEAMCNFVNTCVPGKHSLRIAAYEFQYLPFLTLLKKSIDKGIDIQIIYDARDPKVAKPNREAVSAAELTPYCKERLKKPGNISHNKFMVKLSDGNPVSVWTGGTNFKDGGIFGHSNVAHVVENESIAKKYLDYWNALHSDPDINSIRLQNLTLTPDLPAEIPAGTSVIFSPRKGKAVLERYAEMAQSAKDALFMTFAFGMGDDFKFVYENSKAPLRIALLERFIRMMPDDTDEEIAKKETETAKMQKLRNKIENIFAVGNRIVTNKLDGWLMEKLSGLNGNVNYVHNKFALIDPLSDDPIVIAGSANFSEASTTGNDENMLIVRGNKRIADIYLGEYWRLFKHFSFRESIEKKWNNDQKPKPLIVDDSWWARHFGKTSDAARRKYFANVKI